LKQKASNILGGSSQNSAADTGANPLEKEVGSSKAETGVTWDDVRHRYKDTASLAREQAAAAAGSVQDKAPVYESETRRNTADQVADYANY
jgi:hypothetical protein